MCKGDTLGSMANGSRDTQEQAEVDHDRNLIGVLERARQCNLKFNKKNLELRVTEVPYMGHLLTSKGLVPDPQKVQAVIDKPKPDGVPECFRVSSTIWLSLDVCEPLSRLIDKDAVWCWMPKHDAVIESIKQLVTSHPVLRYYDVKEEVTIQCDASDVGLGAVFFQNRQPVALELYYYYYYYEFPN